MVLDIFSPSITNLFCFVMFCDALKSSILSPAARHNTHSNNITSTILYPYTIQVEVKRYPNTRYELHDKKNRVMEGE